MSYKENSKKRPASTFSGKPSGGPGKFASNGGGKPQYRNTKPQPRSFNGNGGGNSNGHGNGGNKGKGPAWAATPKETAVRRARPITQGGGFEEEQDDDEMSIDEREDDGEAAEAGGEDAGPAEKKPRLSKAEKAALHAAQPHRTTLLPSHPLLHGTLLPLWETARRADLGKEERKKAVSELWDAVKGRVGEVSRGHKGGRVLQTIVKWGGKEERLGVAMELQPQWREMMESKYSKFLMAKLIRYVPQLRPLLIPALTPHLANLLSHAHAVQPLSDFFDLWASAKERRLLVRGFYPREVAIFDGGKGESGLEGTLDSMGDAKTKERILEGVEKTVLDIFNATQKTALAQGIFHRLVFEYITCIFKFLPAEEADKKMHELLTSSLESLPDIVHTKDGSAAVRELLVRGNAKDRKQILQNLKKHIEAMCKDPEAQLVLFTAFDCVDDTKLMGKAFVSDIVALVPSLASDKNGRRAILYLLIPTSTKHFIPSTLSSLASSAQLARDLGTSKKEPATRRKELVGYASAGLLEAVASHAEELVRDAGAGLLVQEVILHAQGDKSAAVEALVQPLTSPYPDPAPDVQAVDPASSHVLDLAHSSRTYKTMLSGGHFDNKTSSVVVLDETLPAISAKAIWSAISSEESGGDNNVVRVAKGNAAFLLLETIEALVKSGKGEQVENVLGDPKVIDAVRAGARKGAGMLADRLEKL